MSADASDLSRDTVFDQLSNQRRRIVLTSVADNSQSISLADLAKDVARCEQNRPHAGIPNEEILTIQTSLHHHHLPKLEDAGVVEYDHDRAEVQSSGAMERIEPLLRA